MNGMKHAAEDVLNPQFKLKTDINATRLRWDLGKRKDHEVFESYLKGSYELFSPEIFKGTHPIHLEIGAGTGHFIMEMAKANPDITFLAVERDRMRGNALAKKSKKAALPNLIGLRGNAVPAVIHAIPSGRLNTIYILYPCPWPKNNQRKHRWYLHPMMPHLIRVLENQGTLVWASDQKFYIDEARYVCENHYQLKILSHGPILSLPEPFTHGRTKFEKTFLQKGQPCYELIVQKS